MPGDVRIVVPGEDRMLVLRQALEEAGHPVIVKESETLPGKVWHVHTDMAGSDLVMRLAVESSR